MIRPCEVPLARTERAGRAQLSPESRVDAEPFDAVRRERSRSSGGIEPSEITQHGREGDPKSAGSSVKVIRDHPGQLGPDRREGGELFDRRLLDTLG
jgi:hypothetical protein